MGKNGGIGHGVPEEGISSRRRPKKKMLHCEGPVAKKRKKRPAPLREKAGSSFWIAPLGGWLGGEEVGFLLKEGEGGDHYSSIERRRCCSSFLFVKCRWRERRERVEWGKGRLFRRISKGSPSISTRFFLEKKKRTAVLLMRGEKEEAPQRKTYRRKDATGERIGVVDFL